LANATGLVAKDVGQWIGQSQGTTFFVRSSTATVIIAANTSGLDSRPSATAALAFGCRHGGTLPSGPSLLRLSGKCEEITNPLDYLLALWQATALSPIGVDDGLVQVDVKQSYRSLLDFRFEAEFLLDRGRQTGGRTQEASLVTVDNLYRLDLAHLA